jgi:hypothetical protein
LLHRGSAFVLLLRPASSEPATIKLIFLFERAQGLFMRVCISYFASSFACEKCNSRIQEKYMYIKIKIYYRLPAGSYTNRVCSCSLNECVIASCFLRFAAAFLLLGEYAARL